MTLLLDGRKSLVHRARMRRPLALLLAGLLLVESGCGAFIFHNPESVVLTCNVPGASVEASGEGAACTAPGTIKLDRTTDHLLVVKAPGYAPERVRLDSHLSWWRILISLGLNGAHGIFTLFISTGIGLAIDFGAGAWQALEEDEVFVELHREGFDAHSLAGMRSGEVAPLAPADRDSAGPRPGAPDALPPDATPAPPAEHRARESCPNCGSHVRDKDRFCSNCGERLP